ncbi:Uu.00g005500.m01.CDS01 [Anthostomella pinea]|uniref:Uu.00g005500.m01.CDS01 n=1 Tax=Anthostomella pinea TaxID=933095 RepID=A0AAI8YIW6_9PEZI|nr:Uu.00g005500.m01.CDS01 [Anthostomella pinea]
METPPIRSASSMDGDSAPVSSVGHLNDIPSQNQLDMLELTTSFICQQCREMELSSRFHDFKEEQGRAHPMFITNRTGLDPDCALCQLFAAKVHPDTCKEMFYSDILWQLRSFSTRYGGTGDRDYHKAIDSDIYYSDGLLVFALTEDVRNVLSGPGTKDETTDELSAEGQNSNLEDSDDEEEEEEEHLLEDDELSTTESSNADENSSDDESWPERENRPYGGSVEVGYIKVIDCETFEVVGRTNTMKYVALSYTWNLANGDMVSLRSNGTGSPTAPNSKALPPLIPRVVHDAMTVVTEIGHRYLWVDQFCINQALKEEVADHVSRMDLIYSAADLTLIAASSKGALPGVGSTPRICQQVLNISGSDDKEHPVQSGMTLFTAPPPTATFIEQTAWYTRGWCFQEAILSPRRLYFTDREMLFEAEGVSCSDSFPEPHWVLNDQFRVYDEDASLTTTRSWIHRLPRWRMDNQYGLGHPCGLFWAELNFYLELLGHSSVKDLTIQSDAIRAFQGAMKAFSRADPNFSVYQGIPALHIPEHILQRRSTEVQEKLRDFQKMVFVLALSWMFSDIPDLPTYNRNPIRRPDFPSWSWAGWTEATYFRRPGAAFDGSDFVPAIDVQAVESGTGKVVDWEFAPIHFADELEEAKFLIGEGIIVPRSAFMLGSVWYKLSDDDKNGPYRMMWHMGRFLADVNEQSEQLLSQHMDDGTWACLALNENSRATRAELMIVSWEVDEREMIYKGRVLKTCSRADAPDFAQGLDQPRCLIGEAKLVDIDEIIPKSTWREFTDHEKAHVVKRWRISSWSASAVQPRPFGNVHAADGIEAIQHTHDGSWACLTMRLIWDEHRNTCNAKLPVVSWEADEEPRSYGRRQLRTCSRVGLLDIFRKAIVDERGSDFVTEGYGALRKTRFRLDRALSCSLEGPCLFQGHCTTLSGSSVESKKGLGSLPPLA